VSATSLAAPIAAPPAIARPGWPERVREWADTPHVLQASMLIIWIAALGFVLASNASVADARRTIQTIGRDTAPSIVAAQSMKASMVDMDANAANDLLGGPNGVQTARDTYNTDRTAAVTGLIKAARNITYPEEEPLIQTMENDMSLYAGYVSQAQLYNQLGDSASATRSMKTATDLMHQQILPAADQLDAVNFDHLTTTYADRKQSAGLALAMVLIAGLIVIGLLITVQVFVARRTRRTLNLPLLGATLVALVLTGRLVSTLNAETSDLKVAKQDAFDSVHFLWQARAIAYDANGDESLYLLPGFDKQLYDTSFHAKAAQLADRPLTDQLITQAAAGNVQFKGRLADEMNNITFPGELDAATQMLRTYAQYFTLDGQIRAFETGGQHDAAVALDTGSAVGQSDWAFAQFDAALGKTLGINEQWFADSVQRSFDDLNGMDVFGPVAGLILAVLVWLGLRPRLAEYRA
jgi:CHASE3 domain sensor protein